MKARCSKAGWEFRETTDLKLEGPDRFELRFDAASCAITVSRSIRFVVRIRRVCRSVGWLLHDTDD